MRTLILSDIHANLPAFQAVLDDAGSWDNAIFLGDLANFGPHPGECVDLLRSIDAECIMGNHDFKISSPLAKRNFWEEWSREQLSDDQLSWISDFKEHSVYNNDIFLVHGVYDVDYDILPNTPNADIVNAFDDKINNDIHEVWFGHYHYQIDISIKDKTYRCIRPVGHHRDHDIRAGYSVFENGQIKHFRIPYDIEKTIHDTEKLPCMQKTVLCKWIPLLKNAYSADMLKEDISQIEKNNKTFYTTYKGK